MMVFIALVSILSLIVCLFAALSALFASMDNDEKGEANAGMVCLIFFAVLLLSGFFYIYPSSRCNKVIWQTHDPYVTHTLIALKDSNSTYGEFHGGMFCSSGYLDEKLVYTYAYKTGDGGIKTQRVDADDSTIYYNNNPHADWITMTRKYWYYTEKKTICNIYLPEGSVVSDYRVDLE